MTNSKEIRRCDDNVTVDPRDASTEETVKEATWKDDKLDRQADSRFLTRYITAKFDQDPNARSFVLNLNAEWGLGKTYFLDNWARDLLREGYPVVYFNGWENDFAESPLQAFIAEMDEQLSSCLAKAPKAVERVKALVKKADKLTAPSGKSHSAMKRDRAAFKKDLSALVSYIDQTLKSWKLPLLIFVDELDRCRPDYAIQLLEIINHIFTVNGIYFVVATDSSQLASSVQAVYGPNFDANRFLKRFFDQEYTLTEPEGYRFSEYLFDKYKLQKTRLFFNPLSRKYLVTENIDVDLFAIASKYFRLSLRDQEQVCAMLKATGLTWDSKKRIHLVYLLFLLMLRQRSSTLFSEYANAKTVSDKAALFKDPRYRKLIDESVIIRTNKTTDSSFFTPEEKDSFENLLIQYADYSDKTLPRILESHPSDLEAYALIREELLLDMPSRYNPETPPRHELGRYIDIVRKVSHLSRQ